MMMIFFFFLFFFFFFTAEKIFVYCMGMFLSHECKDDTRVHSGANSKERDFVYGFIWPSWHVANYSTN